MKIDSTDTATQLMTTREAATCLAVSEKTLANWRCVGAGPRFVKISHGNGTAGAIRYNARELEQWIEERTVSSTSNASTLAGE